MGIRWKHLVWAAGALLLGPLQAREEWREPLVPAVRVQGEREGLPNLTIQQVVPDAQGRIWAATQEGVGVYNGLRWQLLPMPRQCRSTYVRSVLPASDGTLWVGTQDDGLWEYRNGAWRQHGHATGLPAARINALVEVTGLPSGPVILAGTGDSGAFRWKDGKWILVDGLPHRSVWRMRPDPDLPTRIWIATNDGLAVLNLEQETRAQAVCPPSRGLEVNDICRLRRPDGRVETWLSVWGQGILAWEGDTLRPANGSRPFPSQNPSCLAFGPGPEGIPVLWAGTYNAGCYWLDGGGDWHRLNFPRMSLSLGVYYILPRPGKRPALWVGFQSAGIISVDLEGWRNINLPYQEATLPTLAFAVTAFEGSRQYWVGTSMGAAEWNGHAWRTHGTRDGLPDDRVEAFAPFMLNGKYVLLVSTLKGLATWDGHRWSPFAAPGTPAWRSALQLLPTTVDGQPAIWLGGTKGVALWSRGVWTTLTDNVGGQLPQVFALQETQDRDGSKSLWIGARGSGLSRYRNGQWIRYGLAQGFEHPSVYALLAMPSPKGGNRIWAGTPGGGLGWFDVDAGDGKWHWVTQDIQPQLASNAIQSLSRDPSGGLWITTKNRGVQHITIPQGAEDQPDRWQFQRYGAADGLPSDFCADRASQVDSQGRLWVGTLRGAAIFDPHSLGTPEPLVPVLLDGVTAGGRVLPPQPGFTLPASQRQVTLEFFLPTFHGVEEQAFRTQLLPVEPRPTEWGPERHRDLAGLAPGTYTLRIWGRDAYGRITEPLDVPFSIQYPLWRHPWASVAYLALAGWLATTFTRRRHRLLQEQNAALQNRVREAVQDLQVQKDQLAELNHEKNRLMGILAHDLRNPLGAIQLYADGIGETPEDTAEVRYMAERIGHATGRMMEMIHRLLDVNAIDSGGVKIALAPVDASELLAIVMEEQAPRAAAKGQRLELGVDPAASPLLADAMHLKEVVDNLVTNAIKFTPPGPPERIIHLRLGPGWIEVQDQGPGFRPEETAKAFGRFERLSARPTGGESSTGLGLSIVKALVEAMGGEIQLTSHPGEGATFRISLPQAPS